MGSCFCGVLTGAALEARGAKGGRKSLRSVSAFRCERVFTRGGGCARAAPFCVCVRTSWGACMSGTDGKTSRGLRCNWKRSEVVIAF